MKTSSRCHAGCALLACGIRISHVMCIINNMNEKFMSIPSCSLFMAKTRSCQKRGIHVATRKDSHRSTHKKLQTSDSCRSDPSGRGSDFLAEGLGRATWAQPGKGPCAPSPMESTRP